MWQLIINVYWMLWDNKKGNLLRIIQRHIRLTIVASKRNKCYILWVCVLVIPYPKCFRHTILPSVACQAVSYLCTLCNKGQDFWKTRKLLNIKCFFWFSLQLFFWNTLFWWEFIDMLLNCDKSVTTQNLVFLSY